MDEIIDECDASDEAESISEAVVEDTSFAAEAQEHECLTEFESEPVLEVCEPLSRDESLREAADRHLGETTVRKRRPQSAVTSRRRTQNSAKRQETLPRNWSVQDVLSWLDEVGFCQYRKRFIHNAVDGSLLLELTDGQLKQDLGIGPLGHRRAILKAIVTLQSADGEENQRPSSAPPQTWDRKSCLLRTGGICPGPPQEEHRSRLLNKVERLQTKINQSKLWIEDAVHQLQSDERHLQNLLCNLGQLTEQAPLEKESGNAQMLDQEGKVPWFPIGERTFTRDPFPERRGKERDGALLEETFRPRINASSALLLGRSQTRNKSFLERLSDDLEHRAHKQKLNEKALQDRSRATFTNAMLQKDTEFLLSCLADMGFKDLQKEGLLEYLELHLEEEEIHTRFDLDPVQRKRVMKASGPAKIVALAGAVRTQKFMETYRAEIDGRESKLKALKKKWEKETLKRLDSDELLQRDADRLHEVTSLWGCTADGPIDDLLDDLIKRSLLLKEAEENHQSVDWSTVKDELSKLQRTSEGEKELVAVTVLLSGLPRPELEKLLDMEGEKKQAALYRALRSQKFLAFVAEDIQHREAKLQQYWESCSPKKKILSKDQVESFFDRLIEDSIKRNEKRQQQIQEKRQKEDQMIKELANRTHARKCNRRYGRRGPKA